MRLFLSITFFLAALIGYSQPTLSWVKTVGNFGEQSVEESMWTEDGMILSTGRFASTVSFGTGTGQTLTSAGSTDMFLMMQNSSGGVEWVKRWGGTGEDHANAVGQDADGNIFLIGTFSGSLPIGTDTLVTNGNLDIVVMKLDSLGNVIWHFQFGGVNDDQGRDLAIDDLGNVNIAFEYRIAGQFETAGQPDSLISNGAKDAGIIQLDAVGNVNWKTSIGSAGSSDRIASIAVDSLNRVYGFGEFRDTVDFDAGPGEDQHTAWGTDLYLLKLEPDGSFIWMKQLGNISEEFPSEILIEEGDILLTGQYKGAFGVQGLGNDTVVPSLGHYDVFIVKCDLDGNFGWLRAVGGEIFDDGMSVSRGPQGQVYCVGVFTGSMDIDPTAGVQMANGLPARRTMFIQKLTADGDFMWASEFVANADCYMRSVRYKDGNILVSGEFKGTADIAPFEAEYNIVSDLSTNNGFLALFQECFDGVQYLVVTNCGPFEYNGIMYDTTGVFMDTLYTIDGCENITALDLIILDTYESSIEASGCDSVAVNGTTYFDSGLFVQEYMTQSGCDSIIEVLVEVPISSAYEFEANACSMYEFNGTVYDESGTYELFLVNQAGCDSLVTFDLIIDNLDLSVIDESPTLTASQDGAEYQWLECDADYMAIVGETGQSYMATQNMSYAVEITQGACVDTSACFQVLGIGMQEINASQISLFPNPAMDFVNLFGVEVGAQIEVLDMTGQLIRTELVQNTTLTIDLTGVRSGSYILRIVGTENSYMNLIVGQE